MAKKVQVNIRMDDSLWRILREESEKDNRKMSNYIVTILQRNENSKKSLVNNTGIVGTERARLGPFDSI